jgi:hypothetical protein
MRVHQDCNHRRFCSIEEHGRRCFRAACPRLLRIDAARSFRPVARISPDCFSRRKSMLLPLSHLAAATTPSLAIDSLTGPWWVLSSTVVPRNVGFKKEM